MSVTENLVELENVVLSIIEDGAETLEK